MMITLKGPWTYDTGKYQLCSSPCLLWRKGGVWREDIHRSREGTCLVWYRPSRDWGRLGPEPRGVESVRDKGSHTPFLEPQGPSWERCRWVRHTKNTPDFEVRGLSARVKWTCSRGLNASRLQFLISRQVGLYYKSLYSRVPLGYAITVLNLLKDPHIVWRGK